ncbi:MAG TPA: potassium channel protein [Desulfocapsa sulfexigens]|nr:potassium channel protein [Desulfocapsa sulfexigens]
MKRTLQQLLLFLQRENVINLLAVILVIVLSSGALVAFFEPDLSFASGIWWSIVTLTTVGYGDISPSTAEGRILAVLIMFFGIGLLGMLSASLATLLIHKRMKEDRGMCASRVDNHIIICEWNHRTRAVIKELRADAQTSNTRLVLIADIEEKPIDDNNLFFVRGTVNEETLEKANLQKARTVVVLGDDSVETTARDAKVVLSTLTIESINPDVYTVVELVDKANEQYCLRANADEIIIGSEMSSHLIASAASDHGISKVISELLSSRYGNDFYSMSVPEELIGMKFIDVLVAMKAQSNAIVLGVQKGSTGEFISNPDVDYLVSQEDNLLVISGDRDPS